MEGFTPKRNHTNVTIATRVSHRLALRLCMKGFTPKRNHTNVNIATRASHRQVTRLDMN
jgi:hypothetical protein